MKAVPFTFRFLTGRRKHLSEPPLVLIKSEIGTDDRTLPDGLPVQRSGHSSGRVFQALLGGNIVNKNGPLYQIAKMSLQRIMPGQLPFQMCMTI